MRALWLGLLCIAMASAQSLVPSREAVPPIQREFRGAWAAVVYQIDWPSSNKLSKEKQQAEMRAILDRMQELHLNALIFQVRTQCDAVYASAREPWSPWLTGTMGQSPGYDPLEFTIREAKIRGIEVHAWFNPFRALANASHTASPQHITRSAPALTKAYQQQIWCDPGLEGSRQRALAAITDVLQRYDVDGIHLDDYFYPYPKNGQRFPDGQSNAARRRVVDGFMQELYVQVKRIKPWARVGISPFGIWKPGVPEGTTASLNAYEDLGCDARKWLENGWCDYMAPQLYWSINGSQSFPLLLDWWRKQGARPVWPGIATARILSKEDPGRKATEILQQIELSRRSMPQQSGHIHWSVKALMENRGGINDGLKARYATPALPPAMPWLSRSVPMAPQVTATHDGKNIHLRWRSADAKAHKIAVQVRRGNVWQTLRTAPMSAGGMILPLADAVAITAVDRYGQASSPAVLRR